MSTATYVFMDTYENYKYIMVQPLYIYNFLICPWKNMLWYSLEAPCQDASNEYPHVFMDK